MSLALLVDFGSTFTKVMVVDLEQEMVVGRSQAVSTVDKNITIGLSEALERIRINGKAIEDLKVDIKCACSSAAGGLRMVTIGLVPSLTAEAGKRAALGAGAKLVGTYCYELTMEDIEAIEQCDSNILLLTGGTDGGNKDVIIHNAEMLARSRLNIPIIVAGNRAASSRVKIILESAGKTVIPTENVLPQLQTINVEPARELIRKIFMERIVKAKGLTEAQGYAGNILMPTPMAVLKGAELLVKGTREEEGLGELMVVDIGGATTDVHSVAAGRVAQSAIAKGLPEPYAKRTVEGDLGIRYNAVNIVDMVGESEIAEHIHSSSISLEGVNISDIAHNLSQNVGFIPRMKEDFLIDHVLACAAVKTAINRHVGVLQPVFTPHGEVLVQYGKDLTGVKTLIGVGGIFAWGSQAPKKILLSALYNKGEPFILKPKNPNFYIDKYYILYGVGLLSTIMPTKALRIMKRYLQKV